LLGWVVHLSTKSWEGTTPYRIARLIEKIAERQGWKIWREPGSKDKQQFAKAERERLNQRMRWRVLSRDGFRCRACGRSPDSDGVALHVDHVEPLSRGGLSQIDNLQTLCDDCNFGKASS
jgi:5-methylcytosine-specific restriction endonuclease McrA